MLRRNLRASLSFTVIFMCLSIFAKAQITITQQNNAQILAQKLVGDGIIISNATFTGSDISSGIFQNIHTNLLIDSGIVLSTGDVNGIPGPASTSESNQLGTPGDVDLSSIIHGHITHDATILEFDFVPLGDTIKFRYVFSSDEYPTYVCTRYNDVFGFFISGPGFASPQNLAVVPGTSIPVAINSVNNGIPGPLGVIDTCLNMGPGSPFTQYYVSNFGDLNITYNGLTQVFTATALATPCQTYHLKLAIADADDENLDSGVFLEAKSLTASAVTIEGDLVPTDNNVRYVAEGCNQGQIKIKRNHVTSSPLAISLFFGGTATNGVDVATVPSVAVIPANDSVVVITIIPLVDNITEGVEYFKIYVAAGCAAVGSATDSISIEIRDFDTLNVTPKDSIYICKNASLQLQATGGYNTWAWTPAASLNLANIPGPLASPTGTTNYICTADFANCHARDSVLVKIKKLKLRLKRDTPCHIDGKGQIILSGENWTYPLQFSINNGTFGPDSVFSNLIAGTYLMTIKDATNCKDTMSVAIIQTYPDLTVNENITPASCVGTNGQILLNGVGGLSPYFYSTDGINFSVNGAFTVNGGNLTVYVQDYNGCKTPKPIFISNDPPININIGAVTDATCSGNPDGTITVNASGGSGNYSYSSNGINYQTSNVLNVPGATIIVSVKDNKGCTAQQVVPVPLNNFIAIDAGAPKTICEGDNFLLEGTSNTDTVNWSPSTGLDTPTQLNGNAHPVNTIQYYLTATSGICTRKDSVIITVRPAPVADAGDPIGICYGGTIQLHGSGGVHYFWRPTDYMTYPDSSSPTIRPLEDMTYYLNVEDIYGCRSLVEDFVNVNTVPAVKMFAGYDTIIAVNQPLQLSATDVNNSGVTQFIWTPSYGLDDPSSPHPVARLDKDTTYILTGITPEGCEGSDDIHIRVYVGPDLYVATAFTPDNNNLNDVIHVAAIGIKEFHFFRIFNRWGQMIFETHDRNSGWNGKIKGNDAPIGAYIWIAEGVDYLGRTLNKKGVITLLR